MLRRYSSGGLDTLSIDNKKTIGSGDCNIVIQAPGVSSLHAIIEFHPLSRTYWLRDISITGNTTVNGQIVSGQSELQNGDLIRIGESQPMVFEDSNLRSLNIDAPMNSIPRSNGDLVLPVLGRRIKPESATRRSLSGAFYTTTAPSVATSAKPRTRRSLEGKKKNIKRENGEIPGHSNSLTETGSEGTPRENGKAIKADFPSSTSRNNSTTGDNLLQRVVRLQAEIARKDDEIVLLNHRLTNTTSTPVSEVYRRTSVKNNYQDVPRFPLIRRSSTLNPTNQNFELEAYRAFVGSLAHRLRMFNDKMMSQPLRDYGDIFTEFCRSLEQPFSTKMLEIARDCEIHLESRGFDAIQRCRLRSFVEDERREHIAALMSEVEMLAPVILDGMNIARESCRACAVFTHWSRHLGDTLRVEGLKSNILSSAIDALKEDFMTAQMSRHWLPPSLIPLIKLIAIDVKRREDGIHKDSQTGSWEDESLTLINEEATKHQQENEVLKKKLEDLVEEKNELLSQIESLKMNLEKQVDALEEKNVNISDDVDSILSNTERQIDELKEQMNNLGNKIDDTMELDDSIEKRITILLEKIHEATDPLSKIKQNERKISSNSIVSIDVNATDLEDGMKYLSRENSFQLEATTEDLEEATTVKISPKKDSSKLRARISTIQEESEDEEEQKVIKEEIKSFYHRLCMYLHEFPNTDGEFGPIIIEKGIVKDMINKGTHLLNRLDVAKESESVLKETRDSGASEALEEETSKSGEVHEIPDPIEEETIRHKRDITEMESASEAKAVLEAGEEPEMHLKTQHPVGSSQDYSEYKLEEKVDHVNAEVVDEMNEKTSSRSEVDSLDNFGTADSRVQSDAEIEFENQEGIQKETAGVPEQNKENMTLGATETTDPEVHELIQNAISHDEENVEETPDSIEHHSIKKTLKKPTTLEGGREAFIDYEYKTESEKEFETTENNMKTEDNLAEQHLIENEESPEVNREKIEPKQKPGNTEASVEDSEIHEPKEANHLNEVHETEHDDNHLENTSKSLVDDILSEHIDKKEIHTSLPKIEENFENPSDSRRNSEEVSLPLIGNHVGEAHFIGNTEESNLPRIQEVQESPNDQEYQVIPKLSLPETPEDEKPKIQKKSLKGRRIGRSVGSKDEPTEETEDNSKEPKKKSVSNDIPDLNTKGTLPSPLNKGLTVDSLAEDVSVRLSDDEIQLDSDSDELLNEFQSNRIPLDVVEERQERQNKKKEDSARNETLTEQKPAEEPLEQPEETKEETVNKEAQTEADAIIEPHEKVHFMGNGGLVNPERRNPLDNSEEIEAEERLLRARKEVSSSLASSFLGSEKPKSVCEISHSAHIQSHINTATKVPVVYNQIPVHRMLSESPPIKRKAPPIEEKRIRQPRMLFQLK